MEENKVVKLHLDDIIPNRFQPREVFDERALKELAVSIKEHGVIQPIIVREIDGGKYEIIAGERRYKATAMAGLTTIPAIVRNLDDKEAAKVALLENLQRKNLNPVEEARTYQKILELDSMTQEELAKTMGKSQSAVANKLRLLTLPEEVQNALLKEQISERHARALLNLSDKDAQVEMLHRIIKEKMTVRKVEDEIKGINMQNETNNMANNNDLSTLINTHDNKNEEKGASFLMNPSNKIESKNEINNDIVNYGEIKDDEDDPVNDSFAEDISKGNISTGPQDINKLMEGTKDITSSLMNADKSEDLLNGSLSNDDNKVSFAEKALEESEKSPDSSSDYFSAPDLMNVNMPQSSARSSKTSLGSIYNGLSSPKKNDSLIDFSKKTSNNNDKKEEKLSVLSETLFQKKPDKSIEERESASLGSVLMQQKINNLKDKAEEMSVRSMVEKIRETLKDLERHGAKIDTDEMNFENEYQILIKIDKNK